MNKNRASLVCVAISLFLIPQSAMPDVSGLDDEEEARIAAKAANFAETARKLDETQRKLAEARARLREKFAPKATDEPDLLWGKMLRFRAVNMPEEACKALLFLRRKNSPDFLPGAIASAMMLCNLTTNAPVAEGVMISSYEPPATSHAIFAPGDIVVARDEQTIRRVEDWKTSVGSRYRFWRLDAEGVFQVREAILPAGQPRVGLVNIAEKQE